VKTRAAVKHLYCTVCGFHYLSPYRRAGSRCRNRAHKTFPVGRDSFTGCNGRLLTEDAYLLWKLFGVRSVDELFNDMHKLNQRFAA
jgi:hypothetical protein